MLDRLRLEARAFLDAVRRLDRQMVVVLTAAVVLVFLQLQVGSRAFFAAHVAAEPAAAYGLGGWAWWFGMQGVLGFIIPVAILTLGFKRRPAEIGLGLGDWRLAGLLALLYAFPVVVGTWVLSDGAAFQADYPNLDAARTDWGVFLAYEALFLFYWIGWEYLWRGFVLFGTAPAFGVGAVVVQMVPFALLHADKPVAEAYLSILGGLALGALVWRCRSFWIAVPIHAFQMLALDLWCTLRARSGAEGIGLDALATALRGAGG
ncbi:MAG: CPBP family intramembrane glutamic endopeptidase [Rubricoccaceae bacterium]|nr:CPBP family intramembrane glutamic endopeptidase [Rubricoccaceae bacterium]